MSEYIILFQRYLIRRCIYTWYIELFMVNISTGGTALPVPEKSRRWKHFAESFPKTCRSVLAPSLVVEQSSLEKNAQVGCVIRHGRIVPPGCDKLLTMVEVSSHAADAPRLPWTEIRYQALPPRVAREAANITYQVSILSFFFCSGGWVKNYG